MPRKEAERGGRLASKQRSRICSPNRPVFAVHLDSKERHQSAGPTRTKAPQTTPYTESDRKEWFNAEKTRVGLILGGKKRANRSRTFRMATRVIGTVVSGWEIILIPRGAALREPPKMETTVVNMSIAAPHKYDVLKYEGFRNELLRWRDMHGSVDDHVLIDHLALQCSDDTSKAVLGVYTEATRDDRLNRNFKTLLVAIDRELAKTGQEVEVRKCICGHG